MNPWITNLRIVYYDAQSSSVWESAVHQSKNCPTQGFLLPRCIMLGTFGHFKTQYSQSILMYHQIMVWFNSVNGSGFGRLMVQSAYLFNFRWTKPSEPLGRFDSIRLAYQQLTFGKIGWEHPRHWQKQAIIADTLEAAIFAIDDLSIFWLHSINEYSQESYLEIKW